MSLDTAVATLVSRLETVTARLEAVEKQLISGASAAAPSAGASAAAASSSAGGDASSSASVQEYDQLVQSHIAPLVKITDKIGTPELKNVVGLLQKAVQAQRDFLSIAATSKKPDQTALAKLIEPTSKLMAEIGAIRDRERKSKQFNHLSTISEGVNALGWVVVEPTPAPFVNDARASSEFYSNKILVEFKKSDQDQVDFVHAFNEYLKDLAAYIKKNHTTGLVWNPRGGDATAAKPAASAPKAGGPPPPPPVVAESTSSAPSKPAADPSALFSALNRGSDITSGLKKVTKEMKTKNQDKSSIVPAVVEKKPAAAPKAAAGVKKGTPLFELQDKKWAVEWQENNNNIDISGVELRQTVYVYKCEKSVVRVNGKVNSITLDSCKRVAVVFDDAVAVVELVNCTGCEIQVTGRVPSVAIDKCSGIQVFISKAGLDVEIVTSKSDSVNVLIPDPAGGLDPVEMAVPEQFKTTVVNGKLQTGAVEHV